MTVEELKVVISANNKKFLTAMQGTRAQLAKATAEIDKAKKHVSGLRSEMNAGAKGSSTYAAAIKSIKSSTASIERMKKSLSAATAEVERLKTQEVYNPEYKKLYDDITAYQKKIDTLLERDKKLKALDTSKKSAAWKNLQYDIDAADKKLSAFVARKKQMEADGSYISMEKDVNPSKYQAATDAVKRLNAELSELKAKTNEAEGIAITSLVSSAKSAGSAVDALKQKVKNMGEAAKAGIKKIGVGLLKSAVKPFTNLTNSVKNSTKGMSKLFNLLKGIIVYRVIRAAIKAVSDALKEGVNNAYQYSKATGGPLATSLDKVATNALYFKNSVGAAAVPLINILAPAIDFVTEKLISLVDTFNQVMAKLTGANTWTKAVKVPKEFAEAADSATKANKDLKKSILGIDEINPMSDNSSSETSGPNFSSMFEEVKLSADAASWIDDIKAAIEKGDWAGIGKALGEKVNKLVDSIDLSDLGEKFGKWITGGIEALSSFLETVDWHKIGSKLSDGINNFLKNLDTKKLGKLLSDAFKSLLDFAIGAVEEIDWGQVGQKILDFFKGYDWGGIASKMWRLFGAALGAAVRVLWTFISDAWTSIKKYFNDKIAESKELGGGVISGICMGIADAILGIGDWIIEHMWKPFKEGFKNAFGIHSPSTKIAEFGEDLIAGLKLGLSNIWAKVSEKFTEFKDKLVGYKNTLVESAKSLGSGIVSGIGTGLSTLKQKLTDAFKDPLNGVIGLINNMIGKINDKLSISVSSTLSTILNALGVKVNGGKYQLFNIPKIPTLAEGGFPAAGQMFIAREAGPELVGSIGSRNAVMNNDQIVDSVSKGVYEANAEQNQILRQAVRLLEGILAKDSSVIYSASEAQGAMSRKAMRDGRVSA